MKRIALILACLGLFALAIPSQAHAQYYAGGSGYGAAYGAPLGFQYVLDPVTGSLVLVPISYSYPGLYGYGYGYGFNGFYGNRFYGNGFGRGFGGHGFGGHGFGGGHHR